MSKKERKNRKMTDTNSCAGILDFNVYFARGKRFDNNPGNITYKRLIDQYSTVYKGCRKSPKYKNEIVDIVISNIQNMGGSFFHQPEMSQVKQVFGEWEELEIKQIAKKVRQSLRDRKINALPKLNPSDKLFQIAPITPDKKILKSNHNQYHEGNRIALTFSSQSPAREHDIGTSILSNDLERKSIRGDATMMWENIVEWHKHHSLKPL